MKEQLAHKSAVRIARRARQARKDSSRAAVVTQSNRSKGMILGLSSRVTALPRQIRSSGTPGHVGPFQVSTVAGPSSSKLIINLYYTTGILVFFRRCAVMRELFDLLIELRLSSTAGRGEHQT
jgi:hypothetical protein